MEEWSASKAILLHNTSAHPPDIKHNVIRNFITNAQSLTTHSSSAHRTSTLIHDILRKNGYDTPSSKSYHRIPSIHKDAPLPIFIPFISQYFTNSLTKIINKYPLPFKIVTIPPPNLRKLLIRNRLHDTTCYDSNKCIICQQGRAGDCCRKGVVYSLKCEEYSSEYIGETGRPLHIRIHEHILSLRSPTCPSYIDKPLARHRIEHHQGNHFTVTVHNEHLCRSTVDRKLVEAMLIKLRKPGINVKTEMVETLQLLPRPVL